MNRIVFAILFGVGVTFAMTLAKWVGSGFKLDALPNNFIAPLIMFVWMSFCGYLLFKYQKNRNENSDDV